MTKFNIIKSEDLYGDKYEPYFYIIDENGQKSMSAQITDFGMIKGGNSHTPFFDKEYSVYWTNTKYDNEENDVVDLHNWIGHANINQTDIGVRPCCKYSDIKDDVFNRVEIDDKLYEVEYGCYPQDLLPDKKQDELNTLLEERKLTLKYSNDEYSIYCINDDYYARYNGSWTINNQKILKRTSAYAGRGLWFTLKPVTWIVNEDKDIALSKKVLYSGIAFKEIKYYLDNKFAKDIEFTNTIIADEIKNKELINFLELKKNYYIEEKNKIDEKLASIDNEIMSLKRKKGH